MGPRQRKSRRTQATTKGHVLGHYFHEPFVSGGNLLGVWVLLKLPNNIGLFKEIESGKCFHFVRRAFLIGPYTDAAWHKTCRQGWGNAK